MKCESALRHCVLEVSVLPVALLSELSRGRIFQKLYGGKYCYPQRQTRMLGVTNRSKVSCPVTQLATYQVSTRNQVSHLLKTNPFPYTIASSVLGVHVRMNREENTIADNCRLGKNFPQNLIKPNRLETVQEQ